MLKNYFVIAIRNLTRHKVYTFINIAGLAIGLACSTLILLFLQHEFSYDRHHSKADRIYKVIRQNSPLEGKITHEWGTLGPLGPTLAEEYPEVERGTRFLSRPLWVSQGNKEALDGRVLIVDDEFFNVFDYPMIEGNQSTGLQMPLSAFVTHEYAMKLFGNTDVVGKTIWIEGKFFDNEYTITGLLKNVPKPCLQEFRADVITSTIPSPNSPKTLAAWNAWGAGSFRSWHTYVLLTPNTAVFELQEKLPDFEHRHLGEEVANINNYVLTPLTGIYLYAGREMNLSMGLTIFERYGDVRVCYVFGFVGLFLIAIACINFMNLSTARSARRIREIGMRKVVGAKRAQLVFQFLGESILIALLALILSLGLTELSLPVLNGYLNVQLVLTSALIPILVGLSLVVGVLAGSYPAFFLSSFRPVSVLKVASNMKGGHAAIRKSLVVIQFAISMALMISTLVILRQTDYMRSADMGFNRDALITTGLVSKNAEEMKQQFLQLLGVKHVTFVSAPIGSAHESDALYLKTEQMDIPAKVYGFWAETDFLDTFEIPLVSGRNITLREYSSGHILINETAARMLNVKPGDVVQSRNRGSFEVVGIFKDFHRRPLQQSIKPLLVAYQNNGDQNFLTIRVDMQNWSDVLAHLKKVWKSFEPNRSFEFTFMDDRIDQFYREEEKQGQMLAVGSGLAIVIACLGLLGLIAYTAEVRTKEIGIRKVLGATEVSIVNLLTKEFLLLVGVASVLAWPVAYYAMNGWLANFAYRIELRPGYFVASTGVALVITLVTIAYQALKAARANPVEALRYE